MCSAAAALPMTTLGTVGKMKFGTDMIANLNYVMGETRCELTVLDVAETLQQRYAFISGGRSRDGCPIMSLPDNPHNSEVTEQQYQDVVTYLCSIPSDIRDVTPGRENKGLRYWLLQ
ncbi:guanine nucleotide exchange factor DBS-like [Lingula anatina]|uniref:Guanine nucleotide exchange factor DBS-like n=1 Tax=Lingula anatina TaxID=7574 RepID=A0A1S3IWB6_LINAN|nr:guanine nucleotide exchange factor DBS-like [Lingula anatina]|eukprot:XP_013402482.1 guanine nucleotide exchange factor DBS-like [Lingula anatina]